ncbi:EamA family transporter RarD [Intrasporangium sp.]|uniref:EamA family transporter RarD n=1 Tax=Intrasporangium sp. TaxID=1925024 RepID=UPI00293A88C3|nr:EamA family transporter RarD [Intrasporangium sp.]MDV3220713.1 EamA family transporter RarD [Intrasporangium sp.]
MTDERPALSTRPEAGASEPAPVPRGRTVHSPPLGEVARGTVLGFAAYGIWGLFPLYFDALKPASAWEILAHRILWTLLFCLVLLAVQRDVAWVLPILRRRRLVAGITVAAVLIAVNWVVYVAAVTSGNTSEAALGYFLNPLVTVALGVVVLGERLRVLQWIAVAIGLVAGVYLAVASGRVPVVALTLAFSFALYSLTKKKVGASLPALHGLTLETVVLAPAAAVMLVVIAGGSGLAFGDHGPVHTWLLVGSGVATAVPLLFFAGAARRIPLVSIGLIQFITPVMQLLVAVLLLGEVMSPQRWIGFGIVWVALVVLTVDSLLALRRARRVAALAAGAAAAAAAGLDDEECAIPTDDYPR